MNESKILPFKKGQLVESRSFQSGYRGAWFRSKIKSTDKRRNGQFGYELEYLDFPDEKYTWTKAYQKPPINDRNFKHHKPSELMVRPKFPLVFRESEMPDVKTISEAIVVVNDSWKVGDLIDWWADSCYWSGSVTELQENGEFKIVLLPVPQGEGLMYTECKKEDFRPSLDWSLERGWTVPTPTDSNHGCCARIVNPLKPGKVKSSEELNSVAKRRRVDDTVRVSQSSFASHASTSSPAKAKDAVDTSMVSGTKDNDRSVKSTFLDRNSSLPREAMHAPDTSMVSSKKDNDRTGKKGTFPYSRSRSPRNAKNGADTTMVLGTEGDAHAKKKSTLSNNTSRSQTKAKSTEAGEEANVMKEIAPESQFVSRAKSSSLSHPRNSSKDIETQQNLLNTQEVVDLLSDSDSGSDGLWDQSGVMGNGEPSVGKDDSSSRALASFTLPPNQTSGPLPDETQARETNVKSSETLLEQDNIDFGGPSKKEMALNSMFSDTAEASVLDLEELLQRVKWMNGLLQQNGKASSNNTTKPLWKFIAHHDLSKP